jgi:hypothetical protein
MDNKANYDEIVAFLEYNSVQLENEVNEYRSLGAAGVADTVMRIKNYLDYLISQIKQGIPCRKNTE